MIARLTGLLAETSADALVLDVNGVGYLALASARTLSAIGPVGGQVMVFTEMQVREDAITLFAFGSVSERDWFRLLTSVQGVGGRVALAILSALDPQELVRAISAQDKAMVSRANGVGPKLAERIVRELRDKAGGIAIGPGGASPAPKGGVANDAISALANLGYKPGDAANAVAAAEEELGRDASLDALIRLALRKAAR